MGISLEGSILAAPIKEIHPYSEVFKKPHFSGWPAKKKALNKNRTRRICHHSGDEAADFLTATPSPHPDSVMRKNDVYQFLNWLYSLLNASPCFSHSRAQSLCFAWHHFCVTIFLSPSLSWSPRGLAKPGADVRSPERARRSEFELTSEAASATCASRRTPPRLRHWAFPWAASASCDQHVLIHYSLLFSCAFLPRFSRLFAPQLRAFSFL